MEDLLKKANKSTLLFFAQQLYLDIDLDLSDEEVRQQYRKQVLANSEQILKYLPTEDMMILKLTGALASPAQGLLIADAHHDTIMELFHFAKGVYDEDGRVRIFVATDFAEKTTPYIDKMVKDKDYQTKKKQEYATAQLETYMSNMPRWTLRGHSYNEFNNQN